MKLTGVEANSFLAKPDPSIAGILIYGADVMRVALKRQEAIAAIIGPQGEAEMRLTRLQGGEVRKSPAALLDASREIGFFQGRRAVFVEEATDGVSDSLAAALAEWRTGDAQIVVTAGELKGKSVLKTLFEKHPRAVSIGLYNNPPTRAEVEQELMRAGVTRIDPAAMGDLNMLARDLDPGDFRQFLEKIALYKYHDDSDLTATEVANLAPLTIEAGVDDLILAVANRQADLIGPLLRRLEGQGIAAVKLCIDATRHFRALHNASGGNQAYGAKAEIIKRQAKQWGTPRIEDVLRLLIETDLTLRSTSRAPAMAVMERAFIRIAMMKPR